MSETRAIPVLPKREMVVWARDLYADWTRNPNPKAWATAADTLDLAEYLTRSETQEALRAAIDATARSQREVRALLRPLLAARPTKEAPK